MTILMRYGGQCELFLFTCFHECQGLLLGGKTMIEFGLEFCLLAVFCLTNKLRSNAITDRRHKRFYLTLSLHHHTYYH